MSDTLEENLDRVQKAIAAIEGGGQSVSYEGRAVTKGDLKTLYDRETYLEKRIDRKSRGGIRTRAGVSLMSRKRISLPEPTTLDKFIGWISPEAGVRRLKAKTVMALYGGYTGARKDRRQTKAWQTIDGSADQVTLPDLPALRERSRDLIRNAPLATGAINTVVTNVVGTGLKVQSRMDRDVLKGVLGDSEEDFEAFERAAEREFRYWAGIQTLRCFSHAGFCRDCRIWRCALYWRLAMCLFCANLRKVPAHVTAHVCSSLKQTASAILTGKWTHRCWRAVWRKMRSAHLLAYHVLQAHPGDVNKSRITAMGAAACL